MSDLAGFLLARLAEDEREAEYESDDHSPVRNGGIEYTTVGWGDHPVLAIHPARVLADVAAKRAIVELWRSMTDDWNANTNLDPDDNDAEYLSGASNALYTALKLLALPYADHADYDEGWRP